LWAGAAHELAGNMSGAVEHYRLAVSRVAIATILPLDDPEGDVGPQLVNLGPCSKRLGELSFSSFRQSNNEINKVKRIVEQGLAAEATSSQAEEAVREIGSFFGFKGTRPDNEVDTGPDVMWRDQEGGKIISIELKSEKLATSALTREDVGQSHDSVQWVANNFAADEHLGHLFLCDTSRITRSANPGPNWRKTTTQKMEEIVLAFASEVERVRRLPKDVRRRELETFDQRGEWKTEGILRRLAVEDLRRRDA
jgi:hypothetical protein